MSAAALSAPLLRSPQETLAQSAKGAPDLGNKDAEAAKQFEGLLMANLLQCLRKTVDHSSLFGDSANARGTYEYLLDQAVVNQAMEAGKGWGLADRLQAGWAQHGIKRLSNTQDLIS